MRKFMSATALSAILAAGLGFPMAAMAQSVQQTIEALTPKPGKSRGSRPVVAPPSSDAGHSVPAAAPAAAAPAAPSARPTVAAVTPKPAPAPAAEADAPAIDMQILFASGSADLQPGAMKMLDTLGQALASPQLAGSRFLIEGHTDTVGSRDSNKELSARRAAAVVGYLAGKYRIDTSRLQSVGKGQDDLRVPTADQVAEPRNRVVRVINISG